MLRALKGIRVIRGIRSFPAQSCIIRRSYYDINGDNEKEWMRRRTSQRVLVPKIADFTDIRFEEAFDAVSCENIHDVGLGGYVEVTQGQLEKFLPEGLAGEMNAEFVLSERRAWMVRDSTKLVCRIIEEFEKTGKKARGETNFEPVRQGLAFPLVLPGLTDRKEWPDATLKAFYYGAELNKDFERKTFAQVASESPEGSTPYQSDGSYYPDDTDILNFPQRPEYRSTPQRDTQLKSPEQISDPLSIPLQSDSVVSAQGIEASTDSEAVDATSTVITEEIDTTPPPALPMMYTVNGEGSPVEEFIKTLQLDGKEIPTKIMLTGARGVGKSCTLNQAVLYARQRGWICIFVPEGWEQVWGGNYIEPMTINDPPDPRSEAELQEVERIALAFEPDEKWLWLKPQLEEDFPLKDGTVYDNPSQSALVLRGFWLAHNEVLKDIPLKYPEAVDKYDPTLQAFAGAWDRVKSLSGREGMRFLEVREIVEEDNADEDLDEMDEPVLEDFDYQPDFRPKNLEEFVRMGVAFRDVAGSVFMDLIKELKELDLPEHPVMFAVDEYNYWDSPSSFSYRSRKVMGKEICVPAALDFLGVKKEQSEKYQLKNGLCIGSTSFKHPVKNLNSYEDTKSSIPLVIRVPCYSQVEMAAVVSFYQRQSLIGGSMNTTDVVAYRMQTGSNGRLCRRETTSFFFPLAVRKFGGTTESMLFGSHISDDHAVMRPGHDFEEEEEEEDVIKSKPKKFSKGGKAAKTEDGY